MLTFVSWNMNNRAGAWSHLQNLAAENQVAAALVQEAKNPRILPDGWESNPPASEADPDERWRIGVPRYYRSDSGELKQTRRWYASAVVGTDELQLHPLVPTILQEAADSEFACSHPGQFAVSTAQLADGRRLSLVSLYGIWDTVPHSPSRRFTEATLHRALSDLTPVFQESEADLVLVAGDLNLYSYTDGSVWGDRWMSVLDRFKTYGLEICGPFRPHDEAPLCQGPTGSARWRPPELRGRGHEN